MRVNLMHYIGILGVQHRFGRNMCQPARTTPRFLDNLLTAVILWMNVSAFTCQPGGRAAVQRTTTDRHRTAPPAGTHLSRSAAFQTVPHFGAGLHRQRSHPGGGGEPRLVGDQRVPWPIMQQRLMVVELRKIDQQKKIARSCSNTPSSRPPRSWCAAWRTRSRTPGAAMARPNCCKRSCPTRPCVNTPASSSSRPIACGCWSTGCSAPQRPRPSPDAQRSPVLEQVRRLVDLELPPQIRIECGTTTPSIPEFEMNRTSCNRRS